VKVANPLKNLHSLSLDADLAVEQVRSHAGPSRGGERGKVFPGPHNIWGPDIAPKVFLLYVRQQN